MAEPPSELKQRSLMQQAKQANKNLIVEESCNLAE
jgi:hypothetical protein